LKKAKGLLTKKVKDALQKLEIHYKKIKYSLNIQKHSAL